MPHWIVLPTALKRLRVARAGSHAALAQHSGISERMLRKYESNEDQIVRASTVRVLEVSLGAKALEFARFVDDDPPEGDKERPKITPQAPDPVRTRLETVVHAELDAREAAVKKEGAEALTARALQDIFTVYRLHEGRRFWLQGEVRTQRGIPHREAKLLGGRAGVSARFEVCKRVTKDHDLGVTVHAARAEHTRALQAALNLEAMIIVTVHVVSQEASEAGEGFSSFISAVNDLRPWTLLVEEIVSADGRGRAST